MRIWATVALFLSGVQVQAGDVTLSLSGLTQPGGGALVARDVAGVPRNPQLGVVDPADTSDEARQLRALVARGRSQGFDRILYDNRDWAHSILPQSLFPNLTFLKYGPKIHERRWDYGLAGQIFIPALVFGNSSTAVTAGFAQRSLARLAMTSRGAPALAFRDYTSNSLYVYPEHVDHDERDMFPVNWPFMTVSQGSSGSDQPFLRAIAMTLAAFPADTRAALERAGLIAPTVQMILRRNLTLIRTRAHYLSGAAHPVVFDRKWLQPGRMIGQAAAMQPDTIPPLVHLRVLDETFKSQSGLARADERLFTTPASIARIWRGWNWSHEMEISAERTIDPNGRPLRFEWVILQGDPQRIQIEPVGETGARARVRVMWHPEFTVHPRVPGQDIARKSSRVDIGVFASNGVSDSAPSIVSISFPTHQIRDYKPNESGNILLHSVDYDALSRGTPFDPLLHWSAPWRDVFEYDAQGKMLGWKRAQGPQITAFDANEVGQGRYIKSDLAKGPPVLRLVRRSDQNPAD
ncbi:MAG: hypothetical protein AB8B51_01540 [Sedimentitalea sp.]